MLQDVAMGYKAVFLMWCHFTDTMIHRFELVTKVEDAQKKLRALRQTSCVRGYIQKFFELQYRLPNMLAEEAFYAFLFGFMPHLQQQVGVYAQGDLEVAMAMAQSQEVYRGGEKKVSRKFKKRNRKGAISTMQGNEAKGTVQEIQPQQKRIERARDARSKRRG